jgi:predicted transcriptional regulator
MNLSAKAGDFMAFDTFDEGINLGGMRSKNEIKTLICYLYNSVKENIDKGIIIQAILKQGLANYFETSSAFDDLVMNGNLIPADDEHKTYSLTEKGAEIAKQLDSTVAYTIKEKAYACAVKLLAEKKKEIENRVNIFKNDNGFTVECSVSGGDMDLMKLNIYAPEMEQALILKKNFLDNPNKAYKVMLALLTKDKETVGDALEELYGIV